jgi:dynein heavy chain
LLATRILEFQGKLKSSIYRFLLTGGIALDEKYPELPKSDWLSEKSWKEIVRLSNLEGFEGFY